MMQKTTTVRARLDTHLKQDVTHILDQLGLSISEAITLFMNQIKLNSGLPFAVKIPNKETRKTFKATDQGKGLIYCKSPEDMFKKLDI